MSDTSIYSVVTQYKTDATGAIGPLQNLGRTAERTSRTFDGLERRTRTLGGMLRRFGPLLGITGAGAGAAKVYSGLNEEMERTTQLAAQFNLAFRFDLDPVRQWTQAWSEAEKTVSGLIQSAARLPGESRDFFGTASLLAGPVFKAGGGPADLLRMVENVAITAPFAGARPEDAARQAFRMITGQAGIGDNPLFAQLTAAGLLPSAGEFNALPLAKRFEVLDAAMGKLAQNPFLRTKIDELMATQLGTFRDVLLGPHGIGGKLSRGAFDAFGETLKSLNATLDTHMPAIVGVLRGFAVGIRGVTDLVVAAWDVMPDFVKRAGGFLAGGVSGFAQGMNDTYRSQQLLGRLGPFLPGDPSIFNPNDELRRLHALGENMFSMATKIPGLDEDMGLKAIQRTEKQLAAFIGPTTGGQVMRTLQENFNDLVAEKLRKDFTGEALAGEVTNVSQTFHVRIDLKSDDSPQGIALKFTKAMEEATRAKTRGKRALDPRGAL